MNHAANRAANHAALVIPGLDRLGGAERQVLLLANGLRQRGWRVSVVALSGTGGSAAADLAAAGISFLSLGMRKGLADPRGWLRFHRWLRQHKPDVVHAHLPHAAWLARWSRLATPSRKRGGPVFIDTLHSGSTGTLGRRLGYRFSARLPHWVTSVSQAVAETHLAAGMVRPETLLVLPNGVDTAQWQRVTQPRSVVREQFGLGEEFLWVTCGRLEPVKDHATLLHAMAQASATAHLAIAGNGPLEPELRQLARRLNLEQRVHFLGFVPDVRGLLQAADGFVLSSQWEGLPMALLEAGACGLPIVASDLPAVREIVDDGQTGRLAPGGSSAALARTLAEVMTMPTAERRALGERARQSVIARYALESVLDRWETLYCSLLRG